MEMTMENNGFYEPNYGEIKEQIRKNIRRNLLDEALALSQELSESDPDYYFFQASIFAAKGWTQKAREAARVATQMEPNNGEYLALWNRLNHNAGQNYKAQSANKGYNPSCSCCQLAGCLFCSDCCCESMGGDLITCC